MKPQLIMQVLDAAYLERYYKTPGAQGYSMQDLQLESMADPETVPFESPLHRHARADRPDVALLHGALPGCLHACNLTCGSSRRRGPQDGECTHACHVYSS